MSKPGIAAPIIGASRPDQLDELVKSVEVKLTEEEIAELEMLYQPHHVVGFK